MAADNSLVVPSGKSWSLVEGLRAALESCQVVPAGEDPPGFYFSPDGKTLTLKLPTPNFTGTATCNGDGSITFTFTPG